MATGLAARGRCCRFISALPLFLLGLLFSWAWYAAFISLGVLHLLLRKRSYALFTLHTFIFHFLWCLTCWSLAITTLRGPGYVEKGTAREQDVGIPPSQSVTAPQLRGRRASRDSGVDLDETSEEVRLLAVGADDDDLPLDRFVQKAAVVAGFDAEEARPRHVTLPGDGLLTAKADGGVRYCRKCHCIKPDRAHHCSMCDQCVLLMDHHCPWVSTCVGHRNRKAFTLFLTYATVLSFYCGISATLALLSFVEEAGSADFTPISWAFLMLLGGIFGLVLSGFTGYHWWLVSRNRTTLENMESSNRLRFAPEPDRPTARYRSDYGLSREERRKLNKAASRLNLFDLGWRRNLEQIFGPPTANGTSPFGWAGWLLPSGPVRGDGRSWPINERNRQQLEEFSRKIRLDEAPESSDEESEDSPDESEQQVPY